ncbi:MAG: hypothetical protein KUA33_08490, partial [Methanobacterium sp.]|nr:hypothetical protein [Methanobacterium sp.]
DINQEESPENNLSGIAEECKMLIMQKKLELTDKNGKEPTDEQLACETNIDIEIIRYFNESETDVNDESETDVNNIYDMYGEMNDGTVEATDDDKAKQYKELLKFYNILKKRVPRTDEPISALENIRSKPMFLEALRRCLDEHLVNHEGYLPLKIYILMFKYEGEKNKKDQKAYIIASMSKKKSLPKKTKKSLNASKISREYCGDESKRKDITNEALEKFKKKMRKCITNKVKNMGFNDYDIEGYLESIYRG